jgi:hypothetical protein
MPRAAARSQAVCVYMAAVVYVSTVNAFVNAFIAVPTAGFGGVRPFQRCPRRGMGGECGGAVPLLRRSWEPATCAQRLRSPSLQMAIDTGERVQKILPLYDGEYSLVPVLWLSLPLSSPLEKSAVFNILWSALQVGT